MEWNGILTDIHLITQLKCKGIPSIMNFENFMRVTQKPYLAFLIR